MRSFFRFNHIWHGEACHVHVLPSNPFESKPSRQSFQRHHTEERVMHSRSMFIPTSIPTCSLVGLSGGEKTGAGKSR